MSVYFGPYLRVSAVERQRESTVPACGANCGGSSAMSAKMKFCPDCGAAVIARVTTTSERHPPQPWLVEDVAGHRFTDLMTSNPEGGTTEYAVWTPNHRGYGVSLDTSDVLDVPLLNETERSAQIARFLTDHAAFIAAAEAQLGVTPKLHYGVVTMPGY